jgi:hypothetical protein
MLAERHQGKRHLLLLLEIGAGGILDRGGEERQPRRGGQRIERPHLPERGAPVEAKRAEGVGLGEPLQASAGHAGAQPQFADAAIGFFARGEKERGVGLAKALDLAEAEADGMRRADGGGLFCVAGMDADAAFFPPLRLSPAREERACAFPPPQGGRGLKMFQRGIPIGKVHVDFAQIDAVLAGVADELGRRIEAHRLGVEETGAEDVGIVALHPG